MNNFLHYHLGKLKELGPNAELELRILLKKSSSNNKEIILSNFDIKKINLLKFKDYFERRINNEPISKIFNSKGFWKHNFYVNNEVLDPRPETEFIIEKIINFFPNKSKKLTILDMCTGSGCIAISLAKEYSNSKIIATDVSESALKIARFNAKKIKCIHQINFVNCDLINVIENFDIIISNPPYLSEREYKKTSPEVQLYEPKIALVASNNGYKFYNKIAIILPKIMTNNSRAFLEIGSSQAKKTTDMLSLNNIYCIEVVKDYQKLDRVLILKKC